MSLQDNFVEVACKDGDLTAVCYDDGVTVTNLTYQQTYSLACQVRRVLQKVDVQNTVVGYCGAISAVIPSILVGILESCAAFAIIDKTAPAAYNQHFIKHLGIKRVIADESFYQRHVGQFGDWKIEHNEAFSLNNTKYYLLTFLDVECKYHILPEDRKLAYAIQTSGTTGLPKIVRVPHCCILPNISDFCQLFTVTSKDVVLLTAPLTFDPSVVEIFTAFSRGATLLVLPDVLKVTPAKFVEMVYKRHQATIIQATPSLFRRIGAKTLKKTLLSETSVLRVLAFGGEACPTTATLHRWKDVGNRTTFYNVYGITEVSSWATVHRLEMDTGSPSNESIALGRPLTHTVLEVLDDSGQIVVQGEGQLHVGGPQRICLINDEDPSVLNQKVLRCTGDWVLRNPDCSLLFLGRRDDVIKRNGKKIILSSVEAATASLLEGSSCCCVYEVNVDKLWLFVTMTSDLKLKRKSISRLLGSLLPKYCLPDEIVLVPVFPVTSHGKVDKVALVDHAKSQCSSVPLCVDLEVVRRTFVENWKEISPDFKDDDNFIHQGGDSFSAVRFCQSMALLTGHPLPLLVEKLLQQTFASAWEYIVSCISGAKISIPTHNICHSIVGNKLELEKTEQVAACVLPSNKRFKSDLCYQKRKHDIAIVQRAKPLSDLDCCECNTFVSAAVDFNGNFSLHPKWKYDLRKCVDASPLVIVHCRNKAASVVFLGSHSHCLAAVELESGKELWATWLKGRIESSATASCDQYIFVGCYDCNVYCLNAKDGSVKWQFLTSGEVKSSPCIASNLGLVYIGSHDRHVYAICIELGTCKWMLQPSDGSIFASPCYCESSASLFVATLDGIFCAIDPMTGIVRWKTNCGHPIFSSPAAASMAICFGCVGGLIHCYSKGGKKKWQFATKAPVFSSPCIFKYDEPDEDCVLCASHDHCAYCLHFDSGILLWKIEMDAPIYASPFAFQVLVPDNVEREINLTVGGDSQNDDDTKNIGASCSQSLRPACSAVALVSTKGLLMIVNGVAGRPLATYQFAGEVFSSPVVVGQQLVVGCRDNFLYSLSIN